MDKKRRVTALLLAAVLAVLALSGCADPSARLENAMKEKIKRNKEKRAEA